MSAELHLPEFERPPVVETVLSVRFRESAGLSTALLVQFWELHLRDEFPQVEEQPPYPAPIERLDPDSPPGGVPFQLDTGFPSPRFWFTAGSELVQLQQDWCAYNWRQREPDEEYVRYAATRKRFAEVLAKLERFIEANGGKFEPIQCEVTYVNHIRLTDDDVAKGPLGEVLRGVATHADRTLPPPETARFATSYVMPHGQSGRSLGRLHVIAESAKFGLDRQPAVLLNLTSRGRPQGAGIEDTLAFCDLGREWVVGGFKDLTTEPMHTRWGLKG